MAERHTRYGWWLEEAGLPEARRPLDGTVDADVVIVGGGYTGMWTAWFVTELEPDARVVVLEAEVCGTGPSGRNGGFVNSLWIGLARIRERFGAAAALDVARASEAAVDGVGHWCREQGVDAWYRRGGYLQVSTTPAHDHSPLAAVQAAASLGVQKTCIAQTPSEVRERCCSPLFRGGAYYPAAATVQPARLALGLRERLIEQGVQVFEGSHARRLRSHAGGVEIETHGGRVRANAAVLAAGGRLAAHPSLRRRLTVTSSHMVITEPVPDILEKIGWTGGECITDSRAMVQYFRTTPDGRIAFGWGGGRIVAGARINGRAEVDGRVAAEVERRLARVFPAVRGRRIDHAWGGPIDVSPSHLPVIGSLTGDHVHYAFGYTGNGVGPSRLVGRTLASMALERPDEYTRLALVEPPPVRVPPEPFRYAGGAIIRAALLRRERLEEEGRRPDPLTRFVAGVPERIGVHIGR
ncbi:MAG: FAD-dependent oxidoreductase [Actinobacteria bacterium]|nr:MAG: FAD-dependent oxidoreductase [Actinomycetota bacterium]